MEAVQVAVLNSKVHIITLATHFRYSSSCKVSLSQASFAVLQKHIDATSQAA
jgi:hypothetical protein